MSRPYRPPRRRPRVPKCCQGCGAEKPPSELFYYVDGNNEAITCNSPALCKACYVARYGENG